MAAIILDLRGNTKVKVLRNDDTLIRRNDNQRATVFYFTLPTARSKRAVNDIYAALNGEEQQNRDAIIDELKGSADELTKKLETKRG